MMSFEQMEKLMYTEFQLKQAQELSIVAATEAAHVKAFKGRWKVIHAKLKLLPSHISKIIGSDNCFKENILSKELLESILCSLQETRQLAELCTDLTYRGKLHMQNNLDALDMKLSLHLGDCQLLIDSGMMKETDPSPADGKHDTKATIKSLFARMQIGSTDSKLKALNALIEIMNEDDKNVLIVAMQGACVFVRLLDSNVPAIRERAAVAVCSLASVDLWEHQMVMEGALGPLVRLLESGSFLASEKASASLQSLTQTQEYACSVVSQGGIPALLAITRMGTPVAQAAAAGTLRNLSSCSGAINIMLEENAVPTLLHLLKSGTSDAQEHAAATLQALSHNNEPVTRLIVSEGGVAPIMRFLDGADEISGKEAGALLLHNLSSFACNIEPLLCNAGMVPQLPRLLTSHSPSIQQAAASIVCNLATSLNAVRAVGDAGCIPPLIRMLDAKTRTAQEFAMRALASLLEVETNRKIFLAQEICFNRILQLLDPLHDAVARTSALSALMVLAGSSKCRKQMVSAGLCLSLQKMVDTDLPGCKKLLERLERGRFRNLLRKLDLHD